MSRPSKTDNKARLALDALASKSGPAFHRLLAHVTDETGLGRQSRILFVGATSGQGTTTVSLAASLALARNTPDPVLFLEANIYNPSAGLYLGAGEGPGMLDVLDGRADIQDALYRLERPDLTVFLAGNGDDAEPGMLAKPKFHAALEKASAQFPTVIMDGPCILEHPDACGLMSYATEVILVARANHGRRRDIQAALDILMSSRIEPTGVFFNDFR